MLHWSISLVLIIYSCCLATLGFAGWQLYFHFFIPLWVVSLILFMTVTGMIFIASCWFYYYWDFKELCEDQFEEDGVVSKELFEDQLEEDRIVPMSETQETLRNTASDFQLVSMASHSLQNENYM